MTQKPRTVWALIRKTVRDDAITKAYAKLHGAVAAAADAEGDFHVASAMYLYYKGIVAGINPEEDWWGYAEAKQKQQDYVEQMEAYEKQINDCRRAVAARKEVYDKLRNTGENK